jgi:sigma-B regulation protein RsbU (phosphoserine phosphatase)
VVESLASQAAVALNTQELLRRQEELVRFEHDLQVGRRIQANFLPQELPQPPGWEIAACFQPAREVAGDFYDAFPVAGDRLGLVIADVCDKGVGSALFMALSRSLIRAFGRLDVVPGYQTGVSTSDTEGLLAAINARALDAVKLTSDYIAITHEDMSMFVTLFFGVLDPATGTLSYINAGHNSPFVVSPTGGLKAELTPTGPAVGLLPGMNFEIQQTVLEPGDLLLTFTDGVTEAQDPHGEFFDEERLVSLVEGPATSVAALLERIEASLQAHMADTEQSDDITMLAVRRAGTSQAPPAE